jgi:simple sugar transport system permease protein
MKRMPTWVWALAVLGLVLAFNAVFTPGFFALEMRDARIFGSLVDVLNRAAPVALLALGMTLVIATGGVDLSVGAIMAVAGAIAASLIARPEGTPLAGIDLHGSVPLIIVAALIAAVLCGLFNGVLVSFFDLQPIVATLLLMVAGRGIAQLLANGQIVTFTHPGFASLATGAFLGLPNPVWIVIAGLIAFGLLTRSTALGLFIEATGSNPTAARYTGIDAKRVKLAVYALSGLVAGIAGLILTADIQGADANNAGLYLELDAILAVSVGGTALTGGRFSLAGSIVGALLMQTLTTTILTKGVSPEMTLVLKAVVVVVVCLLQSPAFRNLATRVRRIQA